MTVLKSLFLFGAFAAFFALGRCSAWPGACVEKPVSEKILRVVPLADIEILDPTWSSSYVVRDHGFMIYDTLFGLDAQRKIQPQMVDNYQVSEDKKVWTFTLRDGLEFHDGKPVTSEDVIASLKRWGLRDSLGQRLLDAVSSWESVNARTFRMNLTVPYRLMLESLAKPDTYVPFILPKRLADTPFDKQIVDMTGSGPFIYQKDESRPGEKVVYTRNPSYNPRPEPASGTAGGKAVRVDRVEWIIIKDPQTQANALIKGEVDIIVEPPFTHYSVLKSDSGIQMVSINPLGYFYFLRFNHLEPPFDNPKVRQAAMAAMNQLAFLKTQVGIPELYRTCFSVYHCDMPYATTVGMDFIAKPDLKHAKQLLEESAYGGTPAVVIGDTDRYLMTKLPTVAADLLRQAGFTVDLQSMDSNTSQSRRAQKEGWSIFLTSGAVWSSAMPVSMNNLSGAGYPKATFGWPSDPPLEKLRDAFSLAGSDDERKTLATQIQVRAMQVGTHVPLGEFRTMLAARKKVTGFVTGPITAFWNIEKQ